jgi:hypothetical protein
VRCGIPIPASRTDEAFLFSVIIAFP